MTAGVFKAEGVWAPRTRPVRKIESAPKKLGFNSLWKSWDLFRPFYGWSSSIQLQATLEKYILPRSYKYSTFYLLPVENHSCKNTKIIPSPYVMIAQQLFCIFLPRSDQSLNNEDVKAPNIPLSVDRDLFDVLVCGILNYIGFQLFQVRCDIKWRGSQKIYANGAVSTSALCTRLDIS